MSFKIHIENFGQHHCRAAVFRCVDHRFVKPDLRFINESLKIAEGDFELWSWPGATKQMLTDETFRKILLERIKTVTCELHQVKKLVLVYHWDCGAYGGSAKLGDSEEAKYQEDLRQAQEILHAEFPNLEIMLVYSKLIAPEELEFITIN